MDAVSVIELLDLRPLDGEGGRFRRVWADASASAIYFLIQPNEFSAMHRLDGPELWHHYAGAAVSMLLLHPDGRVSEPVLGDDLAAGERPLIVVEAGVWMGAETGGPWSLVGATMAPPYRDDRFELGDRATLSEAFPFAARRIAALTRERS